MTMEIRKPAVAGSFYPANPVELAKSIATLFSEVERQPLSGRAIGLIAPHAGYPYSGKIAAKAYKLIVGEEFDTVVVVSPSHTVFFKGSSIFSGAGYQTPIGLVESDQELARKIAEVNPASVYFSNMGHASGATRGEHALEVQLPFLQVALGKFKLVAIVMGDQEPDSVRGLGEALAAALKGSNTLLVASTDLSHFHNEKQARKLDSSIQSAIEKYDPELLMETLESGKGEACGGGVVSAVMMAARRLGGKEVKFLDYATSGAVTGDFEEVVGYLSAAIVQGKIPAIESKGIIGAKAATRAQQDALTDEDKKSLLEIAKRSIEAHLKGRNFQPVGNERTAKKRGVFVTLTVDGELRGCIGHIRGSEPLFETVGQMAEAAAFEDPRFDPVTEEELPRLQYEISVLSPLERVKDFDTVVVGKHGLMIKLDMHSGLLLPQVATENKWNSAEFLEHTCLKAGLPKHAYKDKYAEVYRFEAEIF
jgi:AmmeMemoRadiSam system protein B/AmmeMemoRadiSam system protein A